MTPRRRQLDLLLELAARERRTLLQDLAASARLSAAAQERHDTLSQHLSGVADAPPPLQAQGLTLADRQQFFERLRTAVEAQGQVVREQRGREQALRAQLASLDQRTRALTRLVAADRLCGERRDRRRAEQALSDKVAIARTDTVHNRPSERSPDG